MDDEIPVIVRMRVECTRCGHAEDETFEFDMPRDNSEPMEEYVPGTCPDCGAAIHMRFGNAKSVDLLAYNAITKRTFVVQVKTLRETNFFLIDRKKVDPKHTYIFVLLNRPGQHVQYFVVPGADLAGNPQKFGKYFLVEKMPGIHPNVLAELGYENAWELFVKAGF